MRIIFDAIGTVFGSLDHTLRPGIKKTIEELRVGGHTVSFWTSGHVSEVEQLLREFEIEGTVHSKRSPLGFVPDICVDDTPESWMPGRVVEVEPHICEELSGERIDAGRMLSPKAGKQTAKERRDTVHVSDIELFLFGRRAGD